MSRETMDDQKKPEGPSDEALVARIIERDQAAFTLIYDRYSRAVYTLALHTLGPTEAEEVVQDVFLRLWERTEQFDVARGSFAAWFMTIVRNRVRDALRSRSQHERFTIGEEIHTLLENAIESGRIVEDEAISREQQNGILQALQYLPEEQRHVIILAYFGNLSQSALADELQWPLGTVKKRIRLGLQKLRRLLVQTDAAEVESETTEQLL